jgi:hypothetical protein
MQYRTLPALQAAHELAKYAACLAARRGPQARVAALATYLSDEQNKAANDLMRRVDDPCIAPGFDDHVRMTVRSDLLAVAVAEALLEREYPDFVSVVDPHAVDIEVERATAAKLSVAERFGRCMVWSNPAAIETLLKTNPETRGELDAIKGLDRAMGMCVQEGSTLRLSRTFVRGIAALSAYRLAQQLRPRPNGRRG